MHVLTPRASLPKDIFSASCFISTLILEGNLPSYSRPFFKMVKLSQFISAVALLSTPAFASQACTSFYNITVPGAEVLNITSVLQSNVSTPAFPPGPTESGLSFCDVTVVLTHPGENDTVTTEVWLPIVGWNGRFQVRVLFPV